MKRRDLLKTALMMPAIAGLSGCNNKKNEIMPSNNNLNIKPKKTDIYKFSTPLLFDYKAIDNLASYNQIYKKSQITSLYNSIPLPLSDIFNEWGTLSRGSNYKIKTFDDFASYVKHAQSYNFDVTYLLSSPKTFNEKDYNTFKDAIHKLLDNIYDIGIRQIKISNIQIASLINEYNSEFKLTLATITECHSILQYKNLIEACPNITRICMAKDENHNFALLTALRKKYPNIIIEMMLNEGCFKGCPARISHMSDEKCSAFDCEKFIKEDPIGYWFKNGAIYPWFLDYYSAIGINDFKNVQNYERANDTDAIRILPYLDIVEYGIENFTFNKEKYGEHEKEATTFFPFSRLPQNIKLAQVLPYYPDINFFIKNGDKCASICGSECNYCKDKAEELKRFIKKLS